MGSDIHGGDPAAIGRRLGLDGLPAPRLDFSVNLNPLGPSDAVAKLLLRAEGVAQSYPPSGAAPAEAALSEATGLPDSRLIVCSGATEAFQLLLLALKPESVAWPCPSYSGYAELCESLGVPHVPVMSKRSGLEFAPDFELLKASGAKLVFICTPNNPTGQTALPESLLELAARLPETTVAVDESFMDFTGRAENLSLLKTGVPENIVVFKSLTKFHSVAGLRLGFAFGPERIIAAMKALRLPWSVNGIAQAALPLLINDERRAKETVEETARLRDMLEDGLRKVKGVSACPSEANFILCRLASLDADSLQRRLLEMGLLIRSCSNVKGLGPQWIRLAVRPEDETRQLLEALPQAMSGRSPSVPPSPRRSKALLVVGTSSDSGKSVVVSALCRALSNMGLKVAPFKAQNMSLNSYATKEGGEMGRAQVVQAVAARVEPHTDMNPVLLKPLGDSKSQVIVDGQPVCNSNAREYYAMKDGIGERARHAFDRLSGRFDVVVMEGAGSPAEINLLDNDFVNMRMAEHADAPAILVADIDRGGVFASILGTIKLLPMKWRRLVAGVVINKFRGDESLLEPGIREIEELTGVPVLGVLPFIPSLDIDEEDSLGLKKRSAGCRSIIDIAVIRLRQISNFTDFAAFESTPGVSVRYVCSASQLGSPDLAIVPGSKNTIQDMLFLLDSGLAESLRQFRAKGGAVVGICGGYQMLGTRIEDPDGVEGEIKEIEGLGLLPVATIMEQRKEISQVSGLAMPPLPFANGSPLDFHGYEIHCGRTFPLDSASHAPPLKTLKRNGTPCERTDGTVSEDGIVFGSYVHGFFDSDSLRAAFLSWLCGRKGLPPDEFLSRPPRAEAQERELERVARELERCVDMPRILSWLELPRTPES